MPLIFFTLINMGLWSSAIQARISIPSNLNQNQREQALGLLGLGTSSKILTGPYPLGGYSGFELGIGMEFIDLTDLAKMGSGLSNPQSLINYPRLSIGKGFYNDMDLFFQFTPHTENTSLSEYGGIFRWGIFQSTYLPTTISILLQASATNISDKIFTSTLGTDLIAGFTLQHFSLYFGGGQMSAHGRFFGVNAIASQEEATLTHIHTILGGTLQWHAIFIAAQLDRYTESVVSFKIGVRN